MNDALDIISLPELHKNEREITQITRIRTKIRYQIFQEGSQNQYNGKNGINSIGMRSLDQY